MSNDILEMGGGVFLGILGGSLAIVDGGWLMLVVAPMLAGVLGVLGKQLGIWLLKKVKALIKRKKEP